MELANSPVVMFFLGFGSCLIVVFTFVVVFAKAVDGVVKEQDKETLHG